MDTDLHYELGLEAYAAGDFAKAALHLEEVTRRRPEDPLALMRLGNALKHTGRFAQAADVLAEVVKSHPRVPETWSNLGATFLAWGRFDEALPLFERAVGLMPQSAELHFNLGTARQHADELLGAISSFSTALALDRGHAMAWMNLGICQRALGYLDAALDAMRQAVALAPDHPDAQWNLALLELLLGDYESGFARYEWRRRLPGHLSPGGQEWRGELAPDATLHLFAEQGVGDTLQFIRYLPEARQRVGRTVLLCRAELMPLLGIGFDGVDEIRKFDKLHPSALCAPLMSLPHLLDRRTPLILDNPYLRADIALVPKWSEALRSERRLRVGICWQGNPSHRADRRRSMPIEALLPVLRLEGVCFYSLQKHNGKGAIKSLPAGLPVVDLSDTLDAQTGAFMDTAAVMDALDLVLTVDTATAHLAGALGVDCWTMLPFDPDFRWGLGENPWYPRMQLIRQKSRGDWGSVVQEVTARLGQAIANRREAA